MQSPINHSLIIDDDPIQRTVLEAFLRQRGVTTVLKACDGNEALSRMTECEAQLQLIVCDLNMPNLDGVEFFGHLNERNFSGRLLIVSGAHATVANAAARLASIYCKNFGGLLKKPLDYKALDALIFGAT